MDLLLGAGDVGEETADETFDVRSTFTGAGAALRGELDVKERVLETEGEEGLTEVLERRFKGGVVLVRGVGVGVGAACPSPDLIPNSDSNDFLLVVDGVLEALSVINKYKNEVVYKGKEEEYKKKTFIVCI